MDSIKTNFQIRKENITGIIISAGFSKRMRKFKPLLMYNGNSFLNNIATKLCLVCDDIIIVTGYNADQIKNHISEWDPILKEKIKIIYNDNYKRGMFTSLKRGVEAISKYDWVLYHFVDQPTLPNEFYEEFRKQIDLTNDWIQPIYKGQKGHPILFNEKVMDLIASAGDNSNLRNISSEGMINKTFWECKCPEILSDFDTPNDLLELK